MIDLDQEAERPKSAFDSKTFDKDRLDSNEFGAPRLCSGRFDFGAPHFSRTDAARPDTARLDAERSSHSLQATLNQTIEEDVIPRLLLAHRTESTRAPEQAVESRSDRRSVAHLTRILTAGDHDAFHAYVESLSSHGMAWETLCLDLFAPAARLLGDLWRSDDCSFSEVTLAVSMLQRLLRERTDAYSRPANPGKLDRHILLTAMPGSQHTFGLAMVEDFFRRSGWAVRSTPGATARDIFDAVSLERCPVIGLSLSRAEDAPSLPAFIARLRAVSRNKAIAVLVGGPYFNERPGEAVLLGADAGAGDARHAVRESERLIRAVSRN